MKRLILLLISILFTATIYTQEEIFYAVVDSDFVTLVNENAYRNCCAEYEMHILQNEYDIDWYQNDYGEPCDCECFFNLSVTYGPLKDGQYQADVYRCFEGDTVYHGSIEFEINTDQNDDSPSIIAEHQGNCQILTVPHRNDNSKIDIHPNPFTTSTIIEYELMNPQTITITFFDSYARTVDIITEHQQQGLQNVVWKPEGLNEGIYYFRLEAGEYKKVGKVILLH